MCDFPFCCRHHFHTMSHSIGCHILTFNFQMTSLPSNESTCLKFLNTDYGATNVWCVTKDNHNAVHFPQRSNYQQDG